MPQIKNRKNLAATASPAGKQHADSNAKRTDENHDHHDLKSAPDIGLNRIN